MAARATKTAAAGPAEREALEALVAAYRADLAATLADVDSADVKDRASLRRVVLATRKALDEAEGRLRSLAPAEVSPLDRIAASAARKSGANLSVVPPVGADARRGGRSPR